MIVLEELLNKLFLKSDLTLEYCDHYSAEYAVKNWHYTGRLPAAITDKIGVWEDGKFVGCVIFGHGAGGATNGKRFGWSRHNSILELQRVALSRDRKTPVSKIVSMAVKMIRSKYPKLMAIVSYADSAQGHVGIIYQSMNWIYTGESRDVVYKINGKIFHRRSLIRRYGTSSKQWILDNLDRNAERIYCMPKYRYYLPLNKAARKTLQQYAKNYPKKNSFISSQINS